MKYIIYLMTAIVFSNTNCLSQSHEKIDSFLVELLVNSQFMIEWGAFSSRSEFAEIHFLDKNKFLYSRGVRRYQKDSVEPQIEESYIGIWNIDDSIISMIRFHDLFGSKEYQLKYVNYNELLILQFDRPIGLFGDSFVRKPAWLRLQQFPESKTKKH